MTFNTPFASPLRQFGCLSYQAQNNAVPTDQLAGRSYIHTEISGVCTSRGNLGGGMNLMRACLLHEVFENVAVSDRKSYLRGSDTLEQNA